MSDDIIYRQAAIDVLNKLDVSDGVGISSIACGLQEEAIRSIENLPSIQPTLCGYDIEHLMLIAIVLKKENLPPEKVMEALTDIERIISIVRAEIEESLRKSVINTLDSTKFDVGYCTEYGEGYNDGIDFSVSKLSALPFAQPEAKSPKWVAEDRYVKNRFVEIPHCPRCNEEIITGQCYCMICGQHIDWSEEDG